MLWPALRQRVPQMALRLEQSGWLPDLVLCSTAQRTMQTLEAMQATVRHFAGVQVHPSAQAYTFAAMDGMTLRHLKVSCSLVATLSGASNCMPRHTNISIGKRTAGHAAHYPGPCQAADLSYTACTPPHHLVHTDQPAPQELAQEVAGQARRCILCLGHNKGWEEATSALVVRSCLAGAAAPTQTPAPKPPALAGVGQSSWCLICSRLRTLSCVQGTPVRLETANAALLHAEEPSWDLWNAETRWTLVDLLKPA